MLESLLFPIANPDILQLTTSALSIQRICPLVLAVDFPEEAFKFNNFCFRDVRPHLKHGKMRPQLVASVCCWHERSGEHVFLLAVCHSDVNHVVLSDSWAKPVQGVDSSERLWAPSRFAPSEPIDRRFSPTEASDPRLNRLPCQLNDTHSPWTHRLRGTKMTRNGKWTIFGSVSAKRSAKTAETRRFPGSICGSVRAGPNLHWRHRTRRAKRCPRQY